MRRTVATLLVVASPLLLTTPVSAFDDRLPVPVQQVMPALAAPAPTSVATPALPVPAAAAPAVTPPAAPTPVRHAVRSVQGKAPASAADLDDAAYAAPLQAELCRARQIFCGLDRSGRYPAS